MIDSTKPNTTPATCFHCGLDAPHQSSIHADERLFCCNGCLGTYRMIQGMGLNDYYLRREADSRGMLPG